MDKIQQLLDNNPGRKYIVTIPPQFEEHCNNYFSSIQSKFHQTVFRKKLVNAIEIVATMIFLILSIGAVSLLPEFISPYKSVLAGYTAIITIGGIVICFVPFYLFIKYSILTKLFDKLLLQDSLSVESIKFCYLHIVIKHLQNYELNSIREHLKLASKALEDYLDFENVYLISDNNKNGDHVYDIIEDLISNFSWYKADMDSAMIASAYDKLENTLPYRIKNGDSIDLIISALRYFKGYSYGSIDKINKEQVSIGMIKQNISVKEYSEMLLLAFADDMKFIPKYDHGNESMFTRLKIDVKRYFYKLDKKHMNVFMCFTVWVLILTTIFVLAPFYFLRRSGIELTYDTIVTCYAAVLGVAITLTITFHKK